MSDTITTYKLTDASMRTRHGYQWALGEWRETSGAADSDMSCWLSSFESPEAAIFMHPQYTSHLGNDLRLFRAKTAGIVRRDLLKIRSSRLCLIEEIAVPKFSTADLVRAAIYCAQPIYHDDGWQRWANRWLSGKDRAAADAAYAADAAAYAAYAADAAAYAAYAAAYAAADAAAYAAAYAAYAAADAAAGNTFDLTAIIRRAIEDEAAYEEGAGQ